MSVPETISALREAGLDSCPGGGAEIFHPDIRVQIASKKMSANKIRAKLSIANVEILPFSDNQ